MVLDTTTFSLNDNDTDTEISMTADEVSPVVTANSLDLADKFIDISLEESHVDTMVVEENAIQSETLNDTAPNNEFESLTEVQNVPEVNELFHYALLELGHRLWSSSAAEQHYTKGCLWSPDGTCILTPVHLDGKQYNKIFYQNIFK